MIRVCILCYKLFWGNSTLCVSFVLFLIFVRLNAQFVKLNAQFARVNAQFVKENAQPDYPMNALLRICKTKRTLPPFKSSPVSVFLYNSPQMHISFSKSGQKSTQSERTAEKLCCQEERRARANRIRASQFSSVKSCPPFRR